MIKNITSNKWLKAIKLFPYYIIFFENNSLKNYLNSPLKL